MKRIVCYLACLLKTAYQVGKPVDPKPGVKNQEDFSKVFFFISQRFFFISGVS